MFKTHRLLTFLLSVLLLSSVGGLLYGQSGIFDRCGIIPGHGSYGSLPEENIDLFTGNVNLRFRDIYLPGPNGLDLEVWRVYNSKILKDRQSGDPVVQAYHQSWVGMGWTMHMGMVHNYSSSTPVIEFPDGRLETAYQNFYGLGQNIYITRDFLKYDKTIAPPYIYPKLYFKNGVIWTLGASATIYRADGTSDPVRLVTKIENAYGHSISIHYITGTPYIYYIEDAMGRMITFVSSGSPRKLTQVKMEDSQGNDRIFSYSVGNYPNGYHRLDSFTPPLLPATTFEYYDGSSSRYELTKMTTSYGGVLEYSYVNHDFYFNATCLDSRVVNQKKITYNPGEQAKIWNFSYPSYNGVTTGTVQVQGPEYDKSVTNNAYNASSPWKIGLISALQLGNGNYSETYDWTYQQISNTNWYVLGTSMGKAKGPLLTSVIEGRVGDATSKIEYLYQDEPKKYGLPKTVKTYIGEAASLKNTKYLTYYFESHTGFKNRYMLEFVGMEDVLSSQSQMLRKTITSYFEEPGKWGAFKQVQRWKDPGYYIWDYTYSCDDPSTVHISIDPPGSAETQHISYIWGVQYYESMPDFTTLTRIIHATDSSIGSEKRQDEGIMMYGYDNLGRVTKITLVGLYNDISYTWLPNGENKVVITQDANIVTKYWDGMGRDTGYTETGDGTTLYFRKTLDAEGRVISESKGSVNPAHVYSYAYNAAGHVTQITDPLNNDTTITYSGTTKTMTDAENHTTVYEYGDLPGLPTRVTDALNHPAVYTYDAVGRLTNVVFNGFRNHTYSYDVLDHVKTESHPETGTISYNYNNESLLSTKSWGGSVIDFSYDRSSRLMATITAGSWVSYTYNSITGRVQSIIDSIAGWRRENLVNNSWGKLTSETVTIPGLGAKTITYTYDWNNNPTGYKFNCPYQGQNCEGATITNNSLNMPETLSFNHDGITSDVLVSAVSYGPNKMPTSITFSRNGTAYSATYNNAGMLNSTSVTKGATTLYDASYTYDGVGNILGITSTAPALSATFGYDPLNRLTSANYSSGGVVAYNYEYDGYGNMLTVRHNGLTYFNETYDNSNRVIGYSYDARGNLTSASGKLYYWDAQNRLKYIQNAAGEVLGKYLYDDRGLRLMAVPPLPEINVKHDSLDIPDGGDAFLSIPPGSSVNETLTIQNLGDANLILSALTITGENEGDFDVVEDPASPVFPQGTTNFIIQFHPQTSGHKTAWLTIPSNDVDEGQYRINLYGNFEPEINILLAPDGGSWDFGERDIGLFSEDTFPIQNLGEKELILSGTPIVSITGPDWDQFSVEQQPVSPVPPGEMTTFIIRFSPLSEGLKTAAISIVNNDWNENPYDITLFGTGTLGPMKIVEDTAFIVTSPVEGEKLVPGTVHNITWTGAKAVEDVKIEYSTDNGSTYRTIVERTQNIGSYPWLVPQDVSATCLVRISSADGPATTPQSFSYDFKFKVPADSRETEDAPALLIHAVAPDIKTQSSWTADVMFAVNKIRGAEAVTFNSVEGVCGTLDEFLGRWHQVRIKFEIDSLAGSAWLDGRLIFDRIPLRQNLEAALVPEIMVSCSSGTASLIRVEDLEVKFQDQTLKPQNEGEEVSQSIVRDTFETYQTGEFPRKGGWLTRIEKIIGLSSDTSLVVVASKANETRRTTFLNDRGKSGGKNTNRRGESNEELFPGQISTQVLGDPANAPATGAALVDEEDSVSGLRSFKLETLGEGTVSVVKSFSLPDRVPFGVCSGNFAISVIPPDSEGRSGLRALQDRESRLSNRLRGSGKENYPTSNQGLRVPDEGKTSVDSSTRQISSSKSTSNNTKAMTTLSTPRVGNYYLYSFDGKLLQTYNVYGVLLKDYIYMGNRLIAEYDRVGSRYLYYTQDQINSTRIVTDDAGAVVYSATYDPYGGIQQTGQNNSYDPLPKFSGKERDEESELDYFGARYYDRSQYRFISVDPQINFENSIKDSQRLNLYAYCGNKPIVFIDPDGLSYLEYHHRLGLIYLVSGAGEVVGIFPAANNAGNNPFPQGTWNFERHSDNWQTYWPGIDQMGNFIFAVPGHTGMGVHAHEECFPPGMTYRDPTRGCISTTHDAMAAISNMHKSDPLTHLIVERLEPIVPECMTTGLPLPMTTTTTIVVTPLPAQGKDFRGLGPGGI